MKPLFAKYISKDCLVSDSTNERFYIITFKVKFDNGQIEKIQLNTSPNYSDLISCDKTRTGTFFERVPLASWQKTLFSCWKNANQEITNNYLYTFQEENKFNVNCTIKSSTADELDSIFSNPKSWCWLS